MDSFPSPATATSNFNLHYLRPAPATAPAHLLHFLPPPSSHHHRSSATKLPTSSSSSTSTSASFSIQSKHHLVKPLNHPRSSSPTIPSRTTPVHRRAASGYAAALINSAQSNGALAASALEKDARRLLNLLGSVEVREFMCDRSVKDGDKGRLLKVVLEKGKFRGELQAVMNLLADKGRFGIVLEVLDEFVRIYGELRFGAVRKGFVGMAG